MSRLAWLTNLAAPYRRPVWEDLARQAELEVFLLENGGRFGRDSSNRDAEWMAYDDAAYPVREIPTSRISVGERQFFVPLRARSLPGHGFDAVVLGGWESPAYWLAALRGRRAGARLVGFYESTLASHSFRSGPLASARRSFFRRLDAVVVPGRAAERAVLAMGVDPAKIHVGFNPVDVEAIHTAAAEARKDHPVPHGAGHRFLYLGQLISRKNVGSLITALWRLGGSNDSLTIAGTGNLTPELVELRDELGLEDRVTFIGAVPYGQVPELLARHETLVLPSNEEVWGLVVNEALAAGLHVVVTRSCGVAESVMGMEGVFLSDVPDSSVLAHVMRRSRREWSGPIASPEILAHTPEAFADVIRQAAFGG
ncbi:glycosyltransferase family 4 protein [Sinomonas humi]|uniref:glycosyltransferase family 4 protein n=1 Tax=Sinomonas humi TaxID=1338436 RepID=UPI00068FBDB4|nr:glycosyltransferase family 4 protein [Sinomonas humi]